MNGQLSDSRTPSSSLVIGIVSTMLVGMVLGCAPAVSVPATPPESGYTGQSSSTTLAASIPLVASSAEPTRLPHTTHRPLVPSPNPLDPWDELTQLKLQLDRDIDTWLGATRQLIPQSDAQWLTVQRRLHGTGGFLRQAQRYLADHDSVVPPVCVESLSALCQRWNQFENRLTEMNRGQAFAERSSVDVR